jgi:hypothetical protein
MLTGLTKLSSLAFGKQHAGSTLTYTLSQETPRRSTSPMHQFEGRDSDCVSPRIPSTVRGTCREGCSPTIGEWGVWGCLWGRRHLSAVRLRLDYRLEWALYILPRSPHRSHRPRPAAANLNSSHDQKSRGVPRRV